MHTTKRKRPANPNPLQSQLDDLRLNLRQRGSLVPVIEVIWYLADQAGLTLEDLEKYEPEAATLSSSSTSWKDVARNFNLYPLRGFKQLPTFSFPLALLPPSFHREVMKASANWLDVYEEGDSQSEEVASVRLMDAWHIPICALFKGRLVDRPAPETSGDEVEHEVYMAEGVILLVFELKLQFKDKWDQVAQVLLELVSTYKLNSNKGLSPQPPVYAVLSDLEKFYIFRYDGSQFARTEAMYVPDEPRSEFLAGMCRVSDQLFSLLLEGYIGILDAVVARSTKQGNVGDALAQARAAQDTLVGCKRESLQSWEEVGSRGLSYLNESVSLLPKIGSSTDWDATTLDSEIEKVLLAATKEP